jgi:DNA-binding response OmpR family regulator
VRVLVVEDEEIMAEMVGVGLRRRGHAVDVARDGADGLELARLNSYDVVVLDRDLPAVHGDEVCRTLVASGEAARILMLTASASVPDRVAGLSLGADDYLVKPFAFAELVARVEALGRRTGRVEAPALVVGDLVVDRARRVALRGDRDLGLTPKEFGVLEVLAASPGRVISAEELLERVWDENADPFTNAVRVTMVGVRRKLGPPGVTTVRGSGYRLEVGA